MDERAEAGWATIISDERPVGIPLRVAIGALPDGTRHVRLVLHDNPIKIVPKF
jgi:hypothetical protein